MKFIRIISIIFTLVGLAFSQSQISILLVDDDNYSSPDHIPRIETAISDAGYSYTLFNAQDSAASPTAAFMQNFDLVVWYTANDGVGLYFWNGQDTVNTELQSYLDNGGMLWAMGNDIIYDRFGGAPDTFATSEFLYDYMGVSSYDVQSKINDGGIGVPMLIRVPGQTISTLDTIKWYVSGLWYGDGCTPTASAVPVYEFGPDSYVLAGYKTAIYNEYAASKVFGCYFDPYYIDTQANRAIFFTDVLNWFNSQAQANPPTAFNLLAPPNGSDIWINDSSFTLHFDWSESIDPQSGSISYDLYLADNQNLTAPLGVFSSDSTGTILGSSDLLNLFAASDTLDLWWSVKATASGGLFTWASDTFQFRLVENINEPPGSFTLLEPPNQGILTVVEDSLQLSHLFKWQTSHDPDQNLENYHFRLWETGGASLVDSLTGDTLMTMSNARILPLFTVSDTIQALWSVSAQDSQFVTPALDTFALTLIKLPHINQPPLPFSLLLPPDSAQILIDSLSQIIQFEWEATSDPEGDPFHYQFKLFWQNNLEDSLLISTTLDTNILLLEADSLAAVLTSQDTAVFSWTVSAFDQYANTTTSDTFRLSLIENIPGPPSAPRLLYPQDSKGLFFTAGNSTNYLLFWHGSVDPDGDPLNYSLRVKTLTDSLIYSTTTGDTFLNLNIGTYLSSISADTVFLKWDVEVSDGMFQVPSSNGPFQANFAKQKITILFVDDDNYSNHETDLYPALDKIGVTYQVFDCGALAGGDTVEFIPDSQLLSQFDLVLWVTGNDGVGLALWNGDDTVNGELASYLSAGGRMLLCGNDFLYDKYGGAPDVFNPGDFVYDYLGIQSYDAQSKVNDGGVGVPLVYRDSSCTVTTVDTVNWRYSTLWYADAVTPLPNANVIYRMGPSSYVLYGSPSAVYYNTTSFLTMSFFFNIRQINTANYNWKLEQLLFDVLDWMQNIEPISGIETPAENELIPTVFAVKQNYPNPFNPTTTIAYDLPRSAKVRIEVFNLLGQKVTTLVNKQQKAGQYKIALNASDWASGLYFYRVQFDRKSIIRKMLLIK